MTSEVFTVEMIRKCKERNAKTLWLDIDLISPILWSSQYFFHRYEKINKFAVHGELDFGFG